MKNVTITLPEDTAHWARVEAAKAGKSLSRWIGERLEQERSGVAQPAKGLEDFLSGPGYPGIAADLPTRETRHDRPNLHRFERPDLRARPADAGETP